MSDAQYYLSHISAYEREFKKWEGRVEKILKRYRDDSRGNKQDGARFNVLWSNVQTLKAATFSRMPMPDVSRRFRDNDPVGRVAALILERALEFEVQHYKEYGASLRQCVYDRFLGGRGVAWVRYEVDITEDVDNPEIHAEKCPVDYVHWRDFGHAVVRTWEEVPVVWRKVYMTPAALAKRFVDEAGEPLPVVKQIPFDATPDEQKGRMTANDSPSKYALIYEIWDKEAGEAVWLSKSLGQIIDQKPDPHHLEEFFPCPPPIYATLTTDSLVPLPDFTMYQDQAAELDVLADRIDGLIKALKVMGVYDAATPELARLFTEGENGQLIAVKNWQAFAEKKGLGGSIDLVDLVPIAQALKEAYLAFGQVKNQIYEITGISDIIRGETNADETATAQQIKNSYASLRLKTYQDEVERFASRLLQIKAQIICRQYSDETIARIAGVDQLTDEDKQLVPQALQMLRDDVMRAFRIEVSTDSMAYQDEQQEKSDRLEFLGAVSQFIEKAVQAGSVSPELIPLAVEMLKFGVTAFRVGKALEGVIDQAAEQLKAKVAQQAANPPADPNAMQVQADQAMAQMKEQSAQSMENMRQSAETQREQLRLEHEERLAAAEANRQAQTQAAQQFHEQRLAQIEAANEARAQQMQQAHEAQMEALRQQSAQSLAEVNQTLQLLLQRMKSATTIEAAEISAGATLDAAQVSAASQASKE